MNDYWKIDEEKQLGFIRQIVDENGYVVAEADTEYHARIIAAAPEMRDALKDLHIAYCELCKMHNNYTHEFCGKNCNIIKNSKVAIEKATGMPIEEVIKDE